MAQGRIIRATRKLATTSHERGYSIRANPRIAEPASWSTGCTDSPEAQASTVALALGRSDRCIHGHLLGAAGCVVLKAQDGRDRSGLARPQAQRDLATLARRQ